jgi:antitoxin component YwqK of YwqJK toxin-antitoxin module
VLPNVTVNYLDAAGLEFISTDPHAPSALYCDVHASDGYLDGPASCKGANTDEVRLEMTFKGGRLDGKLTVYDPESSKAVLADAAFKNGELDGIQSVYSPTTHKLVHAADWSHGVINGTEEGFDGNTAIASCTLR